MLELDEVNGFIDEQTEVIKDLQKKLNLSYWNASSSGKEEAYREYEKYLLDIEEFFNNKDNFEKVKSFFNSKIKDPLIKRQVKLLYYSYLGNQGDLGLLREIAEKVTKIEKDFNTFRAKIEDREYTDNEIIEILKTEKDSNTLQLIWEASKKQGELVEKELIEIIKLRNKHAKKLGFKNYYVMSLELSEQNEEDIEIIFRELEELTNEPFKKLKEEVDLFLSEKYNIKVEELKPWHYHNLFFQRPPEIYDVDFDGIYSDKDIINISKLFYNSIGLDVADILDRSDLFERKNKYQHAYCIDIDREGDIRTMQNIKNTERWMETNLHELGHSVYDKYIDRNLPWILRDKAHIFTTEAIALLFGRNSKNPFFIRNYCNVSEDRIREISELAVKSVKLGQLVFSRWSQVMFNFERELYKNPDQDLNKLWWSLVKKYQLIDFYRDKPDWASKIHFVSSPVYYHNYLLGELLASQIHNFIIKNILNENSLNEYDYSNKTEVGKYLIKYVFSVGDRYYWNEMIKRATGEYLTPRYYVEQFVI